jgi:uncharacterized short protein YbdD (DUF466 family)
VEEARDKYMEKYTELMIGVLNYWNYTYYGNYTFF